MTFIEITEKRGRTTRTRLLNSQCIMAVNKTAKGAAVILLVGGAAITPVETYAHLRKELDEHADAE